MAEFHILPLHHDAFLSDTSHLGALETGAYASLLMASWRTDDGGLPDDPVMLARMARCSPKEWKRVGPLVLAFWTLCQDGKWRQKRLEIEREALRLKSKSTSRAAKERWRQQHAAKPKTDEKPSSKVRSVAPLTSKSEEQSDRTKLLTNNKTQDAGASPAHMQNACRSDALNVTVIVNEEVDRPSPASAREDDLDDWPTENQDGAAVLTRSPSDNRSFGARTPGDVLAKFAVQTAPTEKRLKRQDKADQDMVRWLTSQGGFDTGKAWSLVMAARDEEDPAHTAASREVERISREHRLGWFSGEDA